MANTDGQANGLMTLRGYARSRGLAPSSVAKAIASGRIARRADGRLDAEEVDRQWAENTTIRINSRERSPAASAFRRAKAAREVFEARLAELQYQRVSAGLLNAEEVRQAAFANSRKARDLVLGIGERLAPAFGPELSAALDAELARVLDELSGAGGPAPESPA